MGYSSYTLDAGAQDLIGAAFFNVGSEPLNIQSITIPGDKITDGRDYIKIYTPGSSYQTYYYYEVTVDDPEAEEPQELGPGWGDGTGARVDNIILDPGQGCWIKTIKACTITIAGQVATSEFETYDLAAGEQDLCASPYPVATNVQFFEIPESKITDGRDYIKIYTPGSSYQTYYYYEVTVDDPEAEEPQELGPGWGDGTGARVDDIVLKLGQGCWIKTIKTAQVKLHNPLTVTDDAE